MPDGVNDFDRENWDDPCQASEYAMDIFTYLRERESSYAISAYMERQPNLSPWMRTLLVDWMVEVQETFELNHETLYLGVKIVDIYLSKVTIAKEYLQLLGAAAMLIACKYDVRMGCAGRSQAKKARNACRRDFTIEFALCASAGTHSDCHGRLPVFLRRCLQAQAVGAHGNGRIPCNRLRLGRSPVVSIPSSLRSRKLWPAVFLFGDSRSPPLFAPHHCMCTM